MPSSIPTPVAAAIGVVPTVLDGVRRLPGKAISLPVYALSGALSTLDRTRREYDNLAERGERLIARLRGVSFDEVEDRVEDALQGTPLAQPYDALEDALEDATDNVTALVRNAPNAVRSAPSRLRSAAGTASASTGRALDRAADSVEDLSAAAAGEVQDKAGDAGEAASSAAPAVASTVDTVAHTVSDAVETVADTVSSAAGTAADTASNAVGTAADTASDVAGTAADTAADAAQTADNAAQTAADTAGNAAQTAAEPDVPAAEAPKGAPTPKATEPDSTRIDTAATTDVVETVERVSARIGGTVLDHDQLPLPDYDHLTLGSLRGRMRSLDVPQLVQLRDYEKAHANRLPIVTMLDNRIAKLATDLTAPLSGSKPTDPVPAKARGGKRGSKVDASTSGPKQNPPSQGVPTNPAQPR